MPTEPEVEAWIEQLPKDTTRGWAKELVNDCGEALYYGPNYSRGAWDNFVDSVRAFNRGDMIAADLFSERARAHALVSRHG